MWWQKLGEAKPDKGITLKQFLKFTVTHYHLLVCGVLQKIWNIALKSTSQKLVFIPNNLLNQMSFASTGDGEILGNNRSAPQQQNPIY